MDVDRLAGVAPSELNARPAPPTLQESTTTTPPAIPALTITEPTAISASDVDVGEVTTVAENEPTAPLDQHEHEEEQEEEERDDEQEETAHSDLSVLCYFINAALHVCILLH